MPQPWQPLPPLESPRACHREPSACSVEARRTVVRTWRELEPGPAGVADVAGVAAM